jgi:Uma2 family endonuclease
MTPLQFLPEIEYPDCDGQPMSDNTMQFEWIVTIKENLEALFADNPDVFVAGDLLWYAVEGHPEVRTAPDAMVVFGRPKGYRGSYKQWREDGIAPQVTFEILSPGNRARDITRKFKFYEHYGVEEYYLYDPDHNDLVGWLRDGLELRELPNLDGWVSPRLGIRFQPQADTLRIVRPDGQPFLTFTEMSQQVEQARNQGLLAKAEAEHRAEEQADEIARLKSELKRLGHNPDATR